MLIAAEALLRLTGDSDILYPQIWMQTATESVFQISQGSTEGLY